MLWCKFCVNAYSGSFYAKLNVFASNGKYGAYFTNLRVHSTFLQMLLSSGHDLQNSLNWFVQSQFV